MATNFEQDLASLFRNNPGIFDANPRLSNHPDARVRKMVAHGLAGLLQRAEAVSHREPYPDADISSYEAAREHLERHGLRSARVLFEAGELEWDY